MELMFPFPFTLLPPTKSQDAAVVMIKKASSEILVIAKDFVKINLWDQTSDTDHPSDSKHNEQVTGISGIDDCLPSHHL
jgi:hypothetical protein